MLGAGAPIPFEAALQNHARPVAPKIESSSQVDAEAWPQFPITADEQLMDFRLSARGNIDALDFPVIL